MMITKILRDLFLKSIFRIRITYPRSIQTIWSSRPKCGLIYGFVPQMFVVQALFAKKNDDLEKSVNGGNKSLINEADDLYTANRYAELYNVLKDYSNGEDVEILWRLSRASFEMGKACENADEKQKLFEEGLSIVLRGIKLNDDHAVLHKWFAILNDYKSRSEGTKARIESALINKEHMMKSIELSDKDPTVVHMLGYWCFAFASLAWYERKVASMIFATPPTSSYEEALVHFERAEKIEPNFYSMNLLLIGKCHEKLGNKSKAIQFLEMALHYNGNSIDDKEAKREAEALLEKLR